MPRHAPEVALIITTYQMPRHLERVLAAAREQTVADRLELIVADDGSTDDTESVVREFARTAPFPVRFVTHRHEGFQLARCRNEGVAHATAPHLVFLDGDCLIPPDHIEQHLRCHRPGVVTNTYCVRLDEATSRQITVESVASGDYQRLVPARDLRGLMKKHLKAWFYTWIRHPTKPALRGGNVGIARADYLRVNGYDENFQGWGCEDDDMGYRLRAAGLRIEYILHRTRTFHLWHPPAGTKRSKHRDGLNYHYLHRPVRLAKCVRGIVSRPGDDLSVRISENSADAAATTFLTERSITATTSSTDRADVELLFWPGRGKFQGKADCRVLVVLDEANCRRLPHQADMVISPSGTLGSADQLRLRLDDISGFWQALGWQVPVEQLAAA